ncbi:hypothetical protein BN439_2437 [Erwinia amylovora Ea644]|nr:hypothetical protein [Erwinia amylovora]CCP03491.1 hypothetical protein BN439_2437 [Erwinia amylovora Ea644]CCP07513.1 hypothetical protein BN440_2492 [Erwinia amylovora MR1]
MPSAWESVSYHAVGDNRLTKRQLRDQPAEHARRFSQNYFVT